YTIPAFKEFYCKVLIEITSFYLCMYVPSCPRIVGQARVFSFGVPLCNDKRFTLPSLPLFHICCIRLPFLIMVDRYDIHIFSRDSKDFGVLKLFFMLIKPTSEIEMVRIIFPHGIRYFFDIGLKVKSTECQPV